MIPLHQSRRNCPHPTIETRAQEMARMNAPIKQHLHSLNSLSNKCKQHLLNEPSLWDQGEMITDWIGQMLHTPSNITRPQHHLTPLNISTDNPGKSDSSCPMLKTNPNALIGMISDNWKEGGRIVS